MQRGRQSAEWDRAALIAAILINTHRDPKKSKAAKLEDFHPFEGKRRRLPRMTPAQLRSYKPVFQQWQANSK
jgi:hypothetical protein